MFRDVAWNTMPAWDARAEIIEENLREEATMTASETAAIEARLHDMPIGQRKNNGMQRIAQGYLLQAALMSANFASCWPA